MKTSKLMVVGAALLAAVATVRLSSPRPARAAKTDMVPGDQQRWTVKFCTRLEQPGQAHPTEVALTGDWTSTIVAVRSGEYDAALELTNLHLGGSVSENAPPDLLERTERRLSRRFWATYHDDGALLAIHFFKDIDATDCNLLQMIATEAQFVRPDPNKMVWNALERDGAGSYLAIYNYAGTNAVVKRKLKYIHTDAEPGAPSNAVHLGVQQSEFRFSLDPNGEINELKGNERVRIGGSHRDVETLVVVTEIRLTNLRRSKASQLIGSLARARSQVVSSPVVTHTINPETLLAQRDDQLLEGRTTEALLEAAITEENNDQTLSQRLGAMFRRRPESIPAALALLRKSGPHNRITNALGAAHNPASIQALSSLARDQALPAPVRIEALSSLVLVQQPSLEAMRIPAALLDDTDPQVASAARIMGGAVARAGRSEHPAEADALDAALIARYRKATDVRDLSDLLAALGNSVGPAVLPVIEEALHDPHDLLRAAAAEALRLAQAPEIDGLLSATIIGDLEPHVRAAAIFATSFRLPTESLLEALMQAAKTDSVEYVRSDAVVQLRAHPVASPDIPETLAWIADHDPKPGIRRLAREGLASAANPATQPEGVSKLKADTRQMRNP